ncbi:tRNA delta(2)-isopentenylpyrophosphate transferase [Thecamonas trahens ATCC 50062]|uniref:tRNA delta(2)-isopentenylpyrophosphate transferase n=1 Tax=Thecamonas trahens ATCC 50062 TaxID=461836 RepID=A0A0L0D2M0_THETB|nr:tRNA delta(2)-isopentenylpyrophosphate transferase [Thecamonas trahens ATCC 50062]KNC46425.1 tRNA delta(2)-isopentenylpyrophosphate transferase [Thecamonas trahens ATCC 50062]|eukprot:XP_013760716.1 tRNA delta(2)-isopentenylpyrophosphate transferase [Thecamonas trahens ATCC 50062]
MAAVEERRRIVAVIGTTAVGKSKLGMALALALDGEIVSCDSIQVYAGLPLASNQPTAAELAAVRHHLVGHVAMDGTYSVHQFVAEAHAAIDDIFARGKVPIVVGGTHYYLNALAVAPLPSAQLAAAVAAADPSAAVDASHLDLAALAQADDATAHAALASVDPVTAARTHPSARRSVNTALRTVVQTGVRHSNVVKAQRAAPEPARYEPLLLWPRAELDVLDARIDARVDAMVDRGLLAELDAAAELLASGGASQGGDAGLVQAIGLKEFAPYLESRTSAALEACLVQHKLATRQYARSQIKYIRNVFVRRGVKVYPLDATDDSASGWEAAVKAPAEAAARAWLAGSEVGLSAEKAPAEEAHDPWAVFTS